MKYGKKYLASPNGGSEDLSYVKIHFPSGKKKRVVLYSEFRKITIDDVDDNQKFEVFYLPPKKYAVETELSRSQYLKRSKKIPRIIYILFCFEVLFLTLYFTSEF